MSSLSRISKKSTFSSHLSNFLNTNSLSQYKKFGVLSNQKQINEKPKIEFRKILLSRNNHSKIDDIHNLSHSRINQNQIIQKFSQRSSIKSNERLKTQNQTNKSRQSHRRKQINMEIIKQKKQEMNFAKPLFRDKIKSINLLKDNERKQDQLFELNIKSGKDEQNNHNSNSSLSKTSKQNFTFLKKQVTQQVKHKFSQNSPNVMGSSRLSKRQKQLGPIDRKTSRPSSSSSNSSVFSNYKYTQKQNQLSSRAQRFNQTVLLNKEQLQQRIFTLSQIRQQFQNIEIKISDLIQQKWRIIQQKLLDKSNKKNQKFSFSRVVAQKNIDMEIMNFIKKLRTIRLNKIKFSQRQLLELNIEKQIDLLEQRKSNIIQKALAESMVQGQLLKKYFSGLNANGLSSSNYKVGQLQKTLKSSKKNDDLKQSMNYSPSKPEIRKSISNTTESKYQYKTPNQEDYEKYRYKHSNFKPNLQPLPKSAYQSQFFSYGNVKMSDKFKQDQNIIFPKTTVLTNSTYRNQYKHFQPQKHDIKELDAYHDKFKDLNIFYFPQKRSLSETNTARKKLKKSLNKYQDQLNYVKKLKTQSFLSSKIEKQLNEKKQTYAKKVFLSQSRKQYDNPQSSSHHFAKSQIKHKNLHSMKYQLKMKFQV